MISSQDRREDLCYIYRHLLTHTTDLTDKVLPTRLPAKQGFDIRYSRSQLVLNALPVSLSASLCLCLSLCLSVCLSLSLSETGCSCFAIRACFFFTKSYLSLPYAVKQVFASRSHSVDYKTHIGSLQAAVMVTVRRGDSMIEILVRRE